MPWYRAVIAVESMSVFPCIHAGSVVSQSFLIAQHLVILATKQIQSIYNVLYFYLRISQIGWKLEVLLEIPRRMLTSGLNALTELKKGNPSGKKGWFCYTFA
jgi:hypothetical protein